MPALASVFAEVRPDFGGFTEALKAGLKTSQQLAAVNVPVSADIKDAQAKMAEMRASVVDLAKRLGGLRASVDSKDATFKIDQMLLRAVRLDNRLGHMRLDMQGVLGAELDIRKLTADAEKLQDTLNNTGPSFWKRTSTWAGLFGELRRILPGGGGGGGGGAAGAAGQAAGQAGAGGATGFAAVFQNPYAAVGVVLAALAAIPFAAQLAAGAITFGLGGALAGIGLLAASTTNKGKAAFKDFSQSFDQDMRNIAKPVIPVLQQVLGLATRVFQSLTGTFHDAMQLIMPGLQMFADALLRAFKQPAVKQSIVEVAAAFSQILKALAPSLPGIIGGIAKGITSIASAVAANPRAFTVIIDFFGHLLGWTLQGIGALARFANYIEAHFLPAMDDMGKWITSHFDSERHAWAASWDQLFQDLIGREIRGGHDIEAEWNTWTHNVGAAFDTARHTLAMVWDNTWMDLRNSTVNGIHTVLNFIDGLPGEITRALASLGRDMFNVGREALSELWSGIKAGVSPITNFLSGFAHGVVSIFRKIWGWFSPSSVMFQAGKDLMLGLEGGIKSHAHRAQRAFQGSLHPTGSGSTIERLMQSMAASIGWTGPQWTALFNVEEREAGFNPSARNPTSGAYGLAQFINGPAEYYQWGGDPNSPAGQIRAMFNYIKSRYGSPEGAWAHELSFGWYDKGGWLPPGLSLALNKTGRPERVVSGADAGGVTVNIYAAPGSFAGADRRAIGRYFAEYLKEYTRTGGKLYPQGVVAR